MRWRPGFAVITACVALAACSGWEGPGNWLNKDYAVGQSASVCTPARDDRQASYPETHELDTEFAGWSGSVQAQSIKCIRHTDPLNVSKAAWVECDVEGPALITRSPAIADESAFVAPAGVFDLRITRSGISCKPAT